MISFRVKVAVLILFVEMSLANCVVFLGDNSLISFFVGELIVLLFIFDLLKTEYKFHIYQILLIYFYYTLCITHSFSGFFDESEYYNFSYVINLTHFVFFVAGYNIIKYRDGPLTFFPRQNIIVFLYMVIPFLVVLSEIDFSVAGSSYNDMWKRSAEEVRASINIVDIVFGSIVGTVKQFFLFIFSSPFIFSILRLFQGVLSFVGSGIKAHIIGPSAMILMVYQIYYKRIKVKYVALLLPLAIMGVVLLAGTHSMRSDLSFRGLLSLTESQFYSSMRFFITNAESSHIIYTADIIERVDKGEIAYRYGFDYYRFFLYPFKESFDNFEFASYVQYSAIRSGEQENTGNYLGLAGELYWNFGVFFFVFSFLMGYALKRFTNYAFSQKPIGVISYLFLSQSVLWGYYRGAGNDLMMAGTFYFLGVLMFLVVMKSFGLKFPRTGRKLVKQS
jgi:hypothetical protein